MGGAIVGAYSKETNNYADQLVKPFAAPNTTRIFADDLLNAGKKAASRVSWVKNAKPTVVLGKHVGVPDTTRMKAITQASGVGAVAFVAPRLVFSSNLKSLYVIAFVRVFANGAHGKSIYLDGGKLMAGARLQDTTPALGNRGVEGIAASPQVDDGAIGARANMWFANDRARIRQAVERIDKIFAAKLGNFLNGQRGTSNPYKT